MSNMIIKTIIFVYRIYGKLKYNFFLNSLKNPREAQKKILKKIEKNLKNSEYEKIFGGDVEKLPFVNYEDIEGFIEGGLTTSKIKVYELTSGSSSRCKKIPYTSSLLKSFQNLFVLWSYDILSNVSFKSYKFYFLITPTFKKDTDKKFGLESDEDYLGDVLSRLLSPFLVKIPLVGKIEDSREFKMLLSMTLISNRDLEAISLWSPSLLLHLMKFIKENEIELISNLEKGSYKNYKFSPVKLNYLGVRECFPSLKFISCWGSFAALKDFEKLERLFSFVHLQKKGLLATEAPITLPLTIAKGFVPLINDIYFEFLDTDKNIYKLNEVKVGKVYSLVISQMGGLYRYKMNDRVRITHFYERTPCFDFVGRDGALGDIVGEKIHETDALNALENSPFDKLIPSYKDKKYFLLKDERTDSSLSDTELVEENLRRNYHYYNARELGQLGDLCVISVSDLKEKYILFLESFCGIKRGDQKSSYLIYQYSDEFLYYLGHGVLPEKA